MPPGSDPQIRSHSPSAETALLHHSANVAGKKPSASIRDMIPEGAREKRPESEPEREDGRQRLIDRSHGVDSIYATARARGNARSVTMPWRLWQPGALRT